MDITIMSDFISNVGFPIVVAILLIHQVKVYNDTYIKLYYELKETIEQNSKIIEQLGISLREKQGK